jgi:hypothetical protein
MTYVVEPHALINVGGFAIRPFKPSIDPNNVAFIARLLDIVVRVVPERALFAHNVLHSHIWNFVRSIANLNRPGGRVTFHSRREFNKFGCGARWI